jgi:hypothetical protein
MCPTSYNILIDAICKSGRELLSKLNVERLQPNIRIYTTITMHFAKKGC